jgi:predicted PurR-regulated permease PerM
VSRPQHHHLPPGERLRRIGIAAWSIIGIAIVVAISIWLLIKIRIVFPPLVLAILVIYLLNPPITRLVGRGVPRPLAAVGVFVAGIGLVVLLAIGVYPLVRNQISEFAEDWPRFRSQLLQTVESTAGDLESRFDIELDTSSLECVLTGQARADGVDCSRVAGDIREAVTGQTERITSIGVTVLEAALVFVIAPLLALYLLIDLPHLQRDLLHLFPESHRAEAADVGSKLGRAVGGFFRGQLLVAFIVGLLSALGFRLIGLPFWLVIGAIAGFFNLIPLVGPFIGGAAGFIVGTISGGIGLGLKAAVVELIVQQIDNHLISPMVMRKTVQLHPATVMLALLAGGTLAGFWGVLLGVPAVAVCKIVLGHLYATRILGEEITPYGRASSPSRAPPITEVTEPETEEETERREQAETRP